MQLFFGRMRRMGTIGALLAVAACASSGLTDAKVGVRDIVSDYRSLTKMTAGPIPVQAYLSIRCLGPHAPRDGKIYGPHAEAFSHAIFMNSLAASAFQERLSTYPVGSIIVKEKFGPYREDKPIGIGGMIKRAPGYDPAHGDWEYFYDPLQYRYAKFESGRLENCRSCHASSSTRDHVFGSWTRS